MKPRVGCSTLEPMNLGFPHRSYTSRRSVIVENWRIQAEVISRLELLWRDQNLENVPHASIKLTYAIKFLNLKNGVNGQHVRQHVAMEKELDQEAALPDVTTFMPVTRIMIWFRLKLAIWLHVVSAYPPYWNNISGNAIAAMVYIQVVLIWVLI